MLVLCLENNLKLFLLIFGVISSLLFFDFFFFFFLAGKVSKLILIKTKASTKIANG